MAEEMASREDPHGASVADVVARAHVSRRTFYEFYADRDECFLATYEWGLRRGAAEMYAAYVRESRWQDGVRAALAALLGLLEREPALARLCIVYVLGASNSVQRRRMQAIETVCEFIDRGRLESGCRIEPPEMAAEGVVGAVLAVVHARLLIDDHDGGESEPLGAESGPLTGLLGPLMNLILLPYFGAARASRELHRPAPRALAGARVARDGTGVRAGMRITYRTARVLQTISKHPGASNREVASHAGIVDQGQISRLLSRLEGLGMIANTGGNSSRGSANAWVLTPHGEEVERGIDV
jgi:AcrR family transcriptional regulator